MRILIVIFIVTISWSGIATAVENKSGVSGETQEAVEPEQTKLDSLAPYYARIWGLNPKEYKRYLELKVIDKHFAADNISPYEVLGKYAETREDQNRYARMFRDKMIENQVRSIEWWAAVQEQSSSVDMEFIRAMTPRTNHEVTELMNAGREIELEKWKTPVPGASSAVIPRGTLFVTADCGHICDQHYSATKDLHTKGRLSGVDVVFVDMVKPDRKIITAWAMKNNISAEEVSSRFITLNYDSKKYQAIRQDRTVPVLVSEDGTEISL